MVSSKLYRKKSNRKYYVQHGLKTKLLRDIKNCADKNYIIIKNVLSKKDAEKCILKGTRAGMVSLQGKERLYDRAGTKSFTKLIRSLPTTGYRTKKDNVDDGIPPPLFQDFYKLVANCLGIAKPYIAEHDKMIIHRENLKVSNISIFISTFTSIIKLRISSCLVLCRSYNHIIWMLIPVTLQRLMVQLSKGLATDFQLSLVCLSRTAFGLPGFHQWTIKFTTKKELSLVLVTV